MGSQTLQRSERTPTIAELAVIVILQDPGASTLGPIEQGEPPCQAHGDAQGILMRWRHVDQMDLLTQPFACLNMETFLIERDGDNPCTDFQKCCLRSQVTRIFYPDHIILFEQGSSRDIDGLLGSRANEHLVRLTTAFP